MFQVCEELQKWEANENYENIKGKRDSYGRHLLYMYTN